MPSQGIGGVDASQKQDLFLPAALDHEAQLTNTEVMVEIG